MNDILLATMPAVIVLVAMLSVRFVEHCLQIKRETGRQKLEREREIRDARRKDRESIVSPIREALTEIQTKLVMRSMWEFASKQDTHSLDQLLPDQASIKKLKEVIVQSEEADMIETMTKRLPLVSQISNKETKKFLEFLIFKFCIMSQAEKDKLTLEYWDKEFNLAFQKLEDYVTLTD